MHVVDELKKADEQSHLLRSQLHESRQLAVIKWLQSTILCHVTRPEINALQLLFGGAAELYAATARTP